MSNNEQPLATQQAQEQNPVKVSVINALANKLECDSAKLVPLLKKTAFATCKTDEEFMAMCMVANTYNLNPILKEIYAFPSRGGAVVPIVGIDGWIKLMNSHHQFDGIEFVEEKDYCKAIIHRKDRSHPIVATEYLAECMGNTEPWKRFPRRMLRHKALAQCARIAFGFAGIYDEDEAQRIIDCEEVESKDEHEAQVKKQSPKDLREALNIAPKETAPQEAEEPKAE